MTGLTADQVASPLKGTALYDNGTLLNGVAINAATSAGLSTDVGWTPTLYDTIAASTTVKATVTTQAGSGKL